MTREEIIVKKLTLASWLYALSFDCGVVECDKCDFNDCMFKNER